MAHSAKYSFAPEDFFDLEHTMHGSLFRDDQPVWAALGKIASYLSERLDHYEGKLIRSDQVSNRAEVGENVYIGPGTVVEPFATIKGPAWIGENCTVRSGAYVRENVIVGDGAMLGNSCEFKNCLLFDQAEVPHYNYVGDSILGYKAHMGAGSICSNVRLDRQNVRISPPESDERIDSGLRKFGAIIGDHTEIGCNSVLNPGSVIGRNVVIYPATSVQGVVASDRIVKNRQTLEVVERR